jgi:hypothetical protein
MASCRDACVLRGFNRHGGAFAIGAIEKDRFSGGFRELVQNPAYAMFSCKAA